MRKRFNYRTGYVRPGSVYGDDAAAEEDVLFREENYGTQMMRYLKARRYSVNTRLRLILSAWAAFLVSCWLWKVAEILVHNTERYRLSDEVMITLLATATLNVIGIITIVMTDLFNGRSEEDKDRD